MKVKIAKIKTKTRQRKNILFFFKKNKSFTVLFLLLIFGLVIGNFVFKNLGESFSFKVSSLFLGNLEARKSFFNLFIESVFSTFIFILIIFLMGLSAIGITLIPPVVFLKGYCAGIFQNFLCTNYGIKGFLFGLLLLLPGFLISCIAITLMAKEAIKISNIFSNLLLNIYPQQNNEKNVKAYLIKTGCVLILTATSALVDVTLSFLFLRFFSF